LSETSRHRHEFIGYTRGMGIDLGYGGDPINDRAITMDQENMYTDFGKKAQNLFGNAADLYWFKDGVLDYAYSSHLIEDFVDTERVLIEWARVLKPKGFLCLLFPDEKRYREVTPNKHWNLSHRHMDFGLKFVTDVIEKIPYLEILEARELFDNNDYNCMVVCRKG
jgi:ubiquinone/menaquinone biosynthesis C-methylase UbiE